MEEHIEEAIRLLRGRVRLDLDADRVLNLALVRLLEIVGEAARRIPAEVQAQRARVPWKEIIGLRNRLIHGYDQVDLDVLWEIVTRDLPQVLDELKRARPPDW